MSGEKSRRTLLMIEIPRDELALRMLQAAIGAKPPAGTPAADALADADRRSPGIAASYRRQAEAAVLYFHECIGSARQPS